MMRLKFLALLLLVFLATSVIQAQGTAEFEKTEQRAEQLMQNGEYSQAIALYRKLVDHEYQKSHMYDNIGLCYFYMKNYPKAKENFRMAVLYGETKSVTMLANLAAAFNEMDDFKKALDYAMKALMLEANPQTVLNAISIANNLRDYAKVEEIYNKYAKPNAEIRNYNPLRGIIAQSYYNAGKYWDAVNEYRTFFKMYTPDKTFPINIESEKIYYLYSLLITAEKLIDEPEAHADPTFIYEEDISALYPEVARKNGADQHFYYMELLGLKTLVYRPDKKQFFGRLAALGSASDDVFGEVKQLRLAGKYDEALKWLDGFNISKITGSEQSDEEKQLRIDIEKYLTYVLKYNESVTLGGKADEGAARQAITLMKKISGNQAIGVTRMSAMMMLTYEMMRNFLFYRHDTSQRDFVKQLIAATFPKMSDKEVEKSLAHIEENGTFK